MLCVVLLQPLRTLRLITPVFFFSTLKILSYLEHELGQIWVTDCPIKQHDKCQFVLKPLEKSLHLNGIISSMQFWVQDGPYLLTVKLFSWFLLSLVLALFQGCSNYRLTSSEWRHAVEYSLERLHLAVCEAWVISSLLRPVTHTDSPKGHAANISLFHCPPPRSTKLPNGHFYRTREATHHVSSL